MPINNVKLGKNVIIFHNDLVNLYGCSVGDNTKIGAFVEIQKGSEIGKNCKISSHSFICEGVKISNEVFIGHGVMFINDKYPRATLENGKMQDESDWELITTFVDEKVSIGSGAVLMCGIRIGKRAIIGAGAVVTKDVNEDETIIGVPGKVLRTV